MRINEVEQAVGITKKNIRFYESEGLITPGREGGNGYRSYSEADVERLQKIKLLRMLDVSIPEIRDMLEGRRNLADGMKRHAETLAARQKSLAANLELCTALELVPGLEQLDMESAQQYVTDARRKGAMFVDVRKRDQNLRIWGAALSVTAVVAFMAAMIGLMVWGFFTDPAGAPPLVLMVFLLGIPSVVILGAVLVLIQRIQEIKEDKTDAYRNY